LLSEGYINTASDLDLFFGGWWNGVYEINVTGQLAASDLSLNLLGDEGLFWDVISESGQANFLLNDDQILLMLNSNFASDYENPGAYYFGAYRDYYLQVGAVDNKVGSYALSIEFVDDYADRIILSNGVMQPNYGVDADRTRDLGLGTIVRTATVGGGVVGTGKNVQGVFNYQDDIDIWKYAGTANEQVSVDLNVGNLVVLDHQGNEIQAIGGTYTLTGDTYLQVSQGNVGWFYQLQLFSPGLFIA
jgi:hypothetical protein